ncbi:hypothetical protein ACH4TV_12305 [Streptomyces sp. NPDC020898]|uniref:hypothetical protein n=1 Tax=Streptomyces sp. NPDC020898 TaxID=3365101 RepID=UPI0037AE3AEF
MTSNGTQRIERENAADRAFAGRTGGQITDRPEGLIGSQTREPAIVGHPFGGLPVQIFAGRGRSAASSEAAPRLRPTS